MTGPHSVQLAVWMPAEIASERAQSIRRPTFETYLNPIEAHLPHEEGKRSTALMIAGAVAPMIELGKIHLDRTAHME